MTKAGHDRIANQMLNEIRNAKRILLISHVSPDGDTLGSALAIRLALLKAGKQADVACADKVPDMLLFMKGAEAVHMPDAVDVAQYDLLFAVDVSDAKRLGAFEKDFLAFPLSVQIDHHQTNPLYAKYNAVDSSACATGVLAYELILKLDVSMDTEIGRCLYTAISTDTGNFSFDSTSAEAFAIMADLMQFPLHINAMNRILFRQRSRAQTMLLARALKSLKFYQDNCVAGMTLSWQDFQKCGALPEHAEAVVNFGIDTIGIQIAFLARETEQGDIKFSMRALAPASVAGIAQALGGGGHALAAGCTVTGPMEQAVDQVMLLIDKHLSELDK